MAQEHQNKTTPIVVYAGFWIRVAASAIDSLLIMAFTFPILFLIYGKAYFSSSQLIVGPADFIISWILPATAVVLFWTKRQATPGKTIFSLRVIDADSGAPLSFGQSVRRYLGYFVSVMPFGLGLLWIGFDAKKQGWHDKLANSIVVAE
jgi:uncharacterized RDD family membrane protein YckC